MNSEDGTHYVLYWKSQYLNLFSISGFQLERTLYDEFFFKINLNYITYLEISLKKL